MEKIAVLAPITKPSDRIATADFSGVALKQRTAKRTSRRRSSINNRTPRESRYSSLT